MQFSILNPTLEFKYSCNYDLLSEISRLGTFVGDTELYKNDPIDYKRKINSFKTFGTKGSSEGGIRLLLNEIYYDSVSNTLFIVDFVQSLCEKYLILKVILSPNLVRMC